jgi:hypothetical protein
MKPFLKAHYMIVETDTNDGTHKAKDTRIVNQSFATLADAEEYIRKDALNTAGLDNCEFIKGVDETWGSDHIIVRVIKTVRPVPCASITIEVKEVK